MANKPSYILKTSVAYVKEATGEKKWASKEEGVAYVNDNGSISIKLNPGISIGHGGGNVNLTLWPYQERSKGGAPRFVADHEETEGW